MPHADERALPSGNDAPAQPAGKPAAARGSRLWLWFAAAFLLQAAAWIAWFAIAAKHRVAEVPLETSRAGFSPPSTSAASEERAEARPASAAKT